MSKLGSTMTPTIFLIAVSLISLDVCHAKNNIIDISGTGVFNAAVLRNQKPVVVYFTKSSCGQCKQILSQLEGIAKANDEKMYLARVDLDQFPNLRKEFEINAVPTTRTYFKGTKLREVEGPLLGGVRAITNNAIKHGEENSKSKQRS